MLGDASGDGCDGAQIFVFAGLEGPELVVVEDAVLLGDGLRGGVEHGLDFGKELLVGDGGVEPVAVKASGVVVGQTADPNTGLESWWLIALGAAVVVGVVMFIHVTSFRFGVVECRRACVMRWVAMAT